MLKSDESFRNNVMVVKAFRMKEFKIFKEAFSKSAR